MPKKRHKRDTRTFAELTFAEQAKSISAQISRLGRSVRAHLRGAARDGRDVEMVRLKCIRQAGRMLCRIAE